MAAQGGFQVLLDHRVLKTPARRPLVVPTRALALAIAAEWEWQVGRAWAHGGARGRRGLEPPARRRRGRLANAWSAQSCYVSFSPLAQLLPDTLSVGLASSSPRGAAT